MSVALNTLREKLDAAIAADSDARYVNAFQAWFRQSCAEGKRPDALVTYEPDEKLRFWERVVQGAEHWYWHREGDPRKFQFRRNDGRVIKPRRFAVMLARGLAHLDPSTDVWPACGDPHCIRPQHQNVGRNREARLWVTDQQIIGAVQTLAMQMGRTPTRDDYDKWGNGPCSSTAIYSRLGKWSKVTKAAGLAPAARRDACAVLPREMCEALRELTAHLGHAPSSYQYYRARDWTGPRDLPTHHETVKKVLGVDTWAEALTLAGVTP